MLAYKTKGQNFMLNSYSQAVAYIKVTWRAC